MYMPLFVFCAALLLSGSAHADVPGIRQIVVDADSSRSLNVTVFYPVAAATVPAETEGESRAFSGIPAIRDADPSLVPHPLVVLSHGYGGSWRNLSWLAEKLVGQGYVVAAPDHPGTTTFDRDPEKAAQLWRRPVDLSRTIDALLADPTLAGPIDVRSIAAIGHSLGGWTVASLAGARFDPKQFEQDCKNNPSLRACALAGELGLTRPELARDLRDPRIKATVSLDLGLARGFTPESLAEVALPVLVFAAGIDMGGMPAELESGWLAAHLPAQNSAFVLVPDAMHFSFMQHCKPGAQALIEAETPGDGIVCRDGGTRGRAAIHDEIAARIIDFLSRGIRAE